MPENCRNCGARLGDVYCGACGQNHRHARLRLAAVFEDAFEGLASFDSRIIRTVVGLTRRPGSMIREYVEGRRIAFTHPLKYALVTCAIWLLVMRQLNPLDLSGFEGLTAKVVSIQRAYLQPMHFVAMPLMVLLLAAAFRSRKLTLLEHYVAVLFAYGHLFLYSTVLILVSALTELPVGDAVHVVVLAAYLGWALGRFYGGSLAWAGARVAGIWLFVTVAITQMIRLGVYLWS